MVDMVRRYRPSLLPWLLVSAMTPVFGAKAALAAAPPNDKCPGAEVIPPAGPFPYLSGLVTNLNEATTPGDPLPSCVTSASRGIWYSFTPQVTADYRISTCSPPTKTTVYDSVLGVFRSSNGTCSGSWIELTNGCGDDECTKQAAVTVSLTAGTTYFIVASKWGNAPPPADERAMQLEITKAPVNDACENAQTLPFERTVTGSLTLAANDYEVSTVGPNCYSLPANPFPIGQPAAPPSAMGRDVAYAFTAPSDGLYNFKAQSTLGGGDLTLHLASSCASGAGPHTLTDCLGASNRNGNSAEYFATEEVVCAPVAGGQTVYVYVDEADVATAGARFTVEASPCISEVEPNDDTTQPAPLACGLVGTIFPAGDQDFYALGSPPAGTRVFAMADGSAGNATDFDMRITTETDTLEYDDANNSTPWGGGTPNIAGTPLTGSPAFLKMDFFAGMNTAEPYHLYTVLQPPGSGLGGSSATAESEPNNTPNGATGGKNLFFSGTITTGGVMGDQDLFKFCAEEGDLIYLSIDGDPLRDETPIDPSVFLLDGAGNELLNWSDNSSFSVAFPSPGTLDATTPRSPAEAAVYRARSSGLHYAGVYTQFEQEAFGAGDYLYSIALDCLRGDEVHADLGIDLVAAPNPIMSNENLDLKIDVVNLGPRMALEPHWTMTIPSGTTLVNVIGPAEWTCTTVGGKIDCQTSTCFPAGSMATFSVQIRADECILPGFLTHAATITSQTTDPNPINDTALGITDIVDGGPCEDGNVCTMMDTCSNGVCLAGPANDCDDNNVCTNDTCVAGGGCMHTNNTNTCDDNNACTTADKCINGQCTGGAPLNCSDGNVCTDDLCDAATGCFTELNTAPCDDGNGCTTADRCASGACVGGPPLACAPLNDCQMSGICDPATGLCAYFLKPDGSPCDDGNACTKNDTCVAGACIKSSITVCPVPPDACHGPGQCNPSDGMCIYPVIGSDLDGDGLGDACDADIDGDGIANDTEKAWGTNPTSKDSDGDDIDDCTEVCLENDGSCFDGLTCNADKPTNTDGDDTIDALDSDSDGDGSSDALEAGDTDLNTPPLDKNNDGLPDYRDSSTKDGTGGAGGDIVLTGGGCMTASTQENALVPLWFALFGLAGWRIRRRRS